MSRSCYLSRRYCPDIYLVGTVLTSPDFRDVDVRMILDEANEKHKGLRNHLSGGRRRYAALGDGTPYEDTERSKRAA